MGSDRVWEVADIAFAVEGIDDIVALRSTTGSPGWRNPNGYRGAAASERRRSSVSIGTPSET